MKYLQNELRISYDKAIYEIFTFQNRSTSFLLLSRKSAKMIFCDHLEADMMLLIEGPHPMSRTVRCFGSLLSSTKFILVKTIV